MISRSEFLKKQIVVINCAEGERLSVKNDNLIVKDAQGSLKHQSTCWKIAMLFIVGPATVTSGVIERAHRFGFPIFLMKQTFRTYEVIGFGVDGNTRLKRRQYEYDGIEVAKHLVKNKIINQRSVLMRQRIRGDLVSDAISSLASLAAKVDTAESVRTLMGIEGAASRAYFKNHFNNCEWKNRCPRAKSDYINATLDYGYSLLFNFVEAITLYFGFDPYVGVLHREFYMRKSLVCDLVEPLRPIIDVCVRNAISRKQFKESDFDLRNGSYSLKNWNESKRYCAVIMGAILVYRSAIFDYIQGYYRCFLKGASLREYPIFRIGDNT